LWKGAVNDAGLLSGYSKFGNNWIGFKCILTGSS